METKSEPTYACANCDWKGENLNEVKDLFERVQPGDTMPDGECPECGCLAFEVIVKPKAEPVFTMARDQYGKTYHNLGSHPRKTLLERLGRKKAAKMFVDTKAGDSKHIGYVIAGLWLTIYTVQEWKGGAKSFGLSFSCPCSA